MSNSRNLRFLVSEINEDDSDNDDDPDFEGSSDDSDDEEESEYETENQTDDETDFTSDGENDEYNFDELNDDFYLGRSGSHLEVITIDNEQTEGHVIEVSDSDSVIIDDPENERTQDDIILLDESKPSLNLETSFNTSTQSDPDNTCIICTDPYTNSSHCVVTLKCGHLFGKTCIYNWLNPRNNNERCPTCNKTAKRRDIIRIYAKNLRPLDTIERDNYCKQLQSCQSKLKNLESQLKDKEAHIKVLQTKIDSLELQIINSSTSTTKSQTNKIKCPPSKRFKSVESLAIQLVHLKDISVQDINSRFHCFLDIMEVLVVSYSRHSHSNTVLFPLMKHGIKKIPLESTSNNIDSLPIHTEQIKGMVLNKYDSTVVTVSQDKTMKITSLFSKSHIGTVNLNETPWSVELMKTGNTAYIIFVGLNNGSIDVYDQRNINSNKNPMFTIKGPSNNNMLNTPVASLTTIEYFYNNRIIKALMSIHLDSCWIYTFENNAITNSYTRLKVPFEGKSISSSYDTKSGHSLITFRPSGKHQTITHCVFDFKYDEETSNLIPNCIQQIKGSHETIPLSRSKIFTNPIDDDQVLISAPNGPSSVCIWDDQQRFVQPINTKEKIYDFELIENQIRFQKFPVLSCLGDEVVKLYKIS